MPLTASRLTKFFRLGDLWLVIGLFGTMLLLVLPVKPFLLDILLALSIGLSLLIMLVILYVREPADFSGFPTLLLFITLYRLALNVSSTRLILLDGYAGNIIEAFGNFVVRGNYVVGMVVFLILVLINFIVITKGAGRIAEVAARFTLDAMPGKQMAIDAELNAGVINESEARARRRAVEQEADFYGAMDGASKFVRGDAIAAILITLINILGGFAIGIVQKGMTMSEALERFTLLSIGDGLVSQIPALITSTAAGILVTRAASKNDLGQELTKQLFFYPRAMSVLTGMLGVMALVPGLRASKAWRRSRHRARNGACHRRPRRPRWRQARRERRRACGGRRETGESSGVGPAPDRAGLRFGQLGGHTEGGRFARARYWCAAEFCPGNGGYHSPDSAAR
jgi:flagellar biosynthesis protein FlhA